MKPELKSNIAQKKITTKSGNKLTQKNFYTKAKKLTKLSSMPIF